MNKEALFNEVKGSLFEYLVGQKLARHYQVELDYIKNIDRNYIGVLGQQDRMVRQFYPEMLSFLNDVSEKCAQRILNYSGDGWISLRLLGKLTSSQLQDDFKETDLLLIRDTGEKSLLSLKLNKKNAYVNTKSAGVRSFLTQYFSYFDFSAQNDFSSIIDIEFSSMASQLYDLHGMDYTGNFNEWVNRGFSELPGELGKDEREILKKYYSKISLKLHAILSAGLNSNKESFVRCLYPLMGFSDAGIKQVVCYHDFRSGSSETQIDIHEMKDILNQNIFIRDHKDTASVEIESEHWILQLRIKPMNKFTTTAMKVNCSVKFKN